MQLFGKVVSPTKSALNLNGNEELLINVNSSRITLSTSLVDKLNVAEKAVGFGYDPERQLGSTPAFIYVIDNVEEGCKVGKSGTVTSKFHVEELVKSFSNEVLQSNRFKLDVAYQAPVQHESGVTLYPITFLENLPDLTRTQKSTTEEHSEEELVMPDARAIEEEVAISNFDQTFDEQPSENNYSFN